MKKNKLIFLEGILSVIINTVLFGLKFWAGIVSGSVAIIADAWHTLSDSLSSVVVIVAAKITGKPADKEHPFGHGRVELIGAIIIGVLLILVGINFFTESIEKLLNPQTTDFGILAIVVTIISVIAKEGIARFSFWAAKKSDSPALKADGWHHRSDALSSLLVLGGILFGAHFPWLDGVMGLIIALLIIYTAIKIIKDGADPLLGEQPKTELIEQIKELAQTHTPELSGLHHFHLHNYGNHKELTFHARIAGATPVKDAHSVVSKIQEILLGKLNIDATIHIEPCR